MIDREKLHKFLDEMCDRIEERGDWVSRPAYPGAKRAILTARQEKELKALGGDTYALSLIEGIRGIANYLLFHAHEFVLSEQLSLEERR